MNNTLITWQEIALLLPAVQSLTHLELGSNMLSGPNHLNVQHFALKHLNLHSNRMHDWDELLEVLRVFPNLEYLILAGNYLGVISFSPSPEKSFFISLMHLSLKDNCVQSLDNMNCLNECLPSIRSLVLSGNPLTKSLSYRASAVALFPNLHVLDNSQVLNKERETLSPNNCPNSVKSPDKPTYLTNVHDGLVDPIIYNRNSKQSHLVALLVNTQKKKKKKTLEQWMQPNSNIPTRH